MYPTFKKKKKKKNRNGKNSYFENYSQILPAFSKAIVYLFKGITHLELSAKRKVYISKISCKKS